MTRKEQTIDLSIGGRNHRITSDDVYLRQMRSGTGNALNSALRGLVGLNRFEPRMDKLFSSLIEKQFDVLDVGANIGCTSILFGHLARSVTAFEPTPRTFELWRGNIAASGLPNITCHKMALGSEEKHAEISYSDSNRSGAFVMDQVNPGVGETASIDVRTLDAVFPALKLPGLDFVKLDVEGYEGKVIEGGWDTIQRYRPVIQLELNSWCLNAQQRTSLPDFLDLLVDRFPFVYGIEKNHYTDVRSHAGRWLVMPKNILEQRYKEMVVAFDKASLDRFHAAYSPVRG